MYSRILCPIDGSPTSNRAVKEAIVCAAPVPVLLVRNEDANREALRRHSIS